MLARAFAAGVPARWVVADSFSGRSGAFRRRREERERASAVMIPRPHAIDDRGRRIRVEQLAAKLPERDSAPWLCLALDAEEAAGRGRWLLVRRDMDDPRADAYWLAYGPAETTEAELVRVCGTRGQVAACFAPAKGEAGTDQYEARTWTAWHRFVTLCPLAHAYLGVVRQATHRDGAAEKGAAIAA
jgi:SRSO17 transposase